MSKKPVKISTVLTRAAKWIDEHGLAKGAYFKHRNGQLLSHKLNTLEQTALAKEKGCKACTWGALYISTYRDDIGFDELEDNTVEAAGYVLVAIEDQSQWAIPPWNDEPERTKEEVVQTLKEAAKAARKDGK